MSTFGGSTIRKLGVVVDLKEQTGRGKLGYMT